MFKYLLLKSIFDLSGVDVVERSKYDMSFKYFLDMALEDSVINPSSLTKFRKLRLQDMSLLDMLIGKTVEIAIEKEVIKNKTIIVDVTHTKARYNITEVTTNNSTIIPTIQKKLSTLFEQMTLQDISQTKEPDMQLITINGNYSVWYGDDIVIGFDDKDFIISKEHVQEWGDELIQKLQ